jgi:hypothetical protein
LLHFKLLEANDFVYGVTCKIAATQQKKAPPTRGGKKKDPPKSAHFEQMRHFQTRNCRI